MLTALRWRDIEPNPSHNGIVITLWFAVNHNASVMMLWPGAETIENDSHYH